MTSTQPKSTEELVAELPPEPFAMAAIRAAAALQTFGACNVELSPGDATLYRFIITAPDPAGARGSATRDFHVCLATSFGRGYPWTGEEVWWGYAAEKWTDRHEWTAHVTARFLNALAPKLAQLGLVRS